MTKDYTEQYEALTAKEKIAYGTIVRAISTLQTLAQLDADDDMKMDAIVMSAKELIHSLNKSEDLV